MSTAREAILARIRAVERVSDPTPLTRSYRRSGRLEKAEKIDLFMARVADYGAEIRTVENDGIGAVIESVCGEHRATRIGVPAGFPDAWRPPGVNIVEDHGLSPQELDVLDGVATGCTVAIADTGTIVLSSDAKGGRRALSLVPDLHICVIEADQVVELVPEAFAVLEPSRPLTFVSGPSATSDIELRRVEGVHGPRRLVVLVVLE